MRGIPKWEQRIVPKNITFVQYLVLAKVDVIIFLGALVIAVNGFYLGVFGVGELLSAIVAGWGAASLCYGWLFTRINGALQSLLRRLQDMEGKKK